MAASSSVPSPSSPSFPSVQLTLDPADAPRVLRLQHAICLPCRSAGSRCDGHQNVTVACTQCIKRGDACVWRLKRTSAVKRERQEEEGEDSENGLSSSEDTEQREEKRVKKERSASVASTGAGGKRGKPPVPSAGWPAKQNLDDGRPSKKHRRVKKEEEKIIGKGKERGKKEENGTQSTGEESGSFSSDSEEEGDPSAAGPSVAGSIPKGFTDPGTHIDGTLLSEHEQLARLLAHFEASEKGQNFLTTQSYKSLFSSIFAQDSADLAKSLHWWTNAQADIKARYLDPSTCSDADWQNLSYLEELLAENASTWDLWPRLPAYTENDSLHSAATRGPAVDTEPNMAEEIAGIALRQLADSSIFDDLESSLSTLHMEALISSHTKRGLPFSTRRHRTTQPGNSTYATPEISDAGYRAKYFNREDVLLDHVEAIRVPLITQTIETLDRVLITVAENRKVQAVRRHRPHSVQLTVQLDKEQEQERMSEVKKGKQRAVDQDEDTSAAVEGERSEVGQGKQRTVGEEDEVSAPLEQEAPSEVREGEHRAVAQDADIPEPAEEEWSEVRKGKRRAVTQDAEPVDEELAEPSKRKKTKKKERQPPGDWKAVILAAASVPGVPRSALKATMDRLEALYGPMGIDVMKRYDALNPPAIPPEVPPDPSQTLFTRLPPIPKTRRNHVSKSGVKLSAIDDDPA